jgi:hypothetical protein
MKSKIGLHLGRSLSRAILMLAVALCASGQESTNTAAAKQKPSETETTEQAAKRVEAQHAEQGRKDIASQQAAVAIAVMKAKEAARLRAEQKVAKEVCPPLYKETANKKIADLTVKEEQQVRACQLLGMYHQ